MYKESLALNGVHEEDRTLNYIIYEKALTPSGMHEEIRTLNGMHDEILHIVNGEEALKILKGFS